MIVLKPKVTLIFSWISTLPPNSAWIEPASMDRLFALSWEAVVTFPMLLTKQAVKSKFDPIAKERIGNINEIETMLIAIQKRKIPFLIETKLIL